MFVPAVRARRIRARLVMVKREESLQEEQGQEAERRPVDRRDRSDANGFGHHVKKRRAQHRAGRKAEVDLQPRVVEDSRQRQQAPQDTDGQNSQAETR